MQGRTDASKEKKARNGEVPASQPVSQPTLKRDNLPTHLFNLIWLFLLRVIGAWLQTFVRLGLNSSMSLVLRKTQRRRTWLRWEIYLIKEWKIEEKISFQPITLNTSISFELPFERGFRRWKSDESSIVMRHVRRRERNRKNTYFFGESNVNEKLILFKLYLYMWELFRD